MTTESQTSAPFRINAEAGAPPISELFSSAIDASPAFVALFSRPENRLVYCNRTAAVWLDPAKHVVPSGLTMQELIGIEHLDRLKHQILPHAEVLGVWTGALDLRDVWGSEFAVHGVLSTHKQKSDGSEWLCLQASKSRVDGSPLDSASVSDREFLHALLETLPDSIFFKDRQGRYIRVSNQLALRFGHKDPNSLLGLTVFDLSSIEDARAAFEAEQQVVRTGQPLRDREQKMLGTDGRENWITTSKFPLRDREGNIVGLLGILSDITEKKLAEQQKKEMEVQMQLAQKLESIGRLASGVAHEINTPAQFITDNTHFIKRSMASLGPVFAAYRALRDGVASGGETKALLDAVAKAEKDARLDYLIKEIPQTIDDTLEGLTRVTQIVRSLKEFSHPNKSSKAPFDLNRSISTTMAVSRHEWKYVADVKLDLDGSLPSVRGIVDQINQVILNLIVNAAQAIEEAQRSRKSSEKGTITLRTRRDGPMAVLEVEDTGTGIPPEAQSHIFEMFFTTKDVGKGTGQGLAIVRSVVTKNHGGAVEFRTEPGKGTTFVIRLPLGEEVAAPGSQQVA